jgi:membrane-associated protein
MNILLPYLVSWLQEYGYLTLWLALYVASAGVPLPIGLVLLAAGAFASLGDFNIVLLAIIAISAAVCGDCTGYFIGRRWGTKVLDWFEHAQVRWMVTAQAVSRSRAYFGQYGGWAVFLSRFLVSALGGTINVLAGADPYPFRRFLLYDVFGETIGVVSSLVLGYFVGASWEALGDLLGGLSGLLVGLLVIAFLVVRIASMIRATKKAQLAERRNLPQVQRQESSSLLGD